jgi:ankyrin repeat protein
MNTELRKHFYNIINNQEAIFEGFNLNLQDEDGNTLLHHAIVQNNIEYIQFLLREKVNINIVNHAGNTPLHFCYYIYLENLENTNLDENILLYMEIFEVFNKIIYLLIYNNADMNIVNKDNKSFLDLFRNHYNSLTSIKYIKYLEKIRNIF